MIRRLVIEAWLVLTLILYESSFATEDVPPDMPDAFGKPCPDFRCASGMTPVPKSRQKFTSTGCSSMGGGMVMMGGGASDEKVYESCCDQWHACYQVCGVSKKVCDDAFKTCTEDICGLDEDCKKDAGIMTLMISMGGCQRFDQGQYGACECVAKSKVEQKREIAIRRFYKKNAPELEEKAESLAKKAETKGKMAALFRKLLAKYPSAIEKVEDPQQAAYRKMMEDAKEKAGEGDGSSAKGGDADSEEEDDDEEEVQEL